MRQLLNKLKYNRKIIFLTFFVFLTTISFFLRLNNLGNAPFWVDEFSTVNQARHISNYRHQSFSSFMSKAEYHNITTHLLTAISMEKLGSNEFSARLPAVIAGSIIPLAIFFMIREITNIDVAFTSSILSTFSYFQITWSRQARSYMLQQLLLLLVIFMYIKFTAKSSFKNIFILFTLLILGVLTHTTFILVILALGIHYLLFFSKDLKKLIYKPSLYIFHISLIFIMMFTGQFDHIYENLISVISSMPNNLRYYHSFLWREQTIITVLSFIGVLIMIFKERKYKVASLLLLPTALYLFFISFMFSPYVSRYLLPIFPLLIIFSGYAISKFGELISKKHALLFSLLITFFIIANGDKFILIPKAFYSVNHDMREIALIDYDRVYEIIIEKGDLDEGKTAVIDTWPDRTRWYLGSNKNYYYTFRWLNSEGLVNGLPKSTPYEINDIGEKYWSNSGPPVYKIIGELSDLKLAMSKYSKGFIWIDDASLPADVIKYAKENFKEEIYLDHYPLDDNPYSIWPGTLYSWGFED